MTGTIEILEPFDTYNALTGAEAALNTVWNFTGSSTATLVAGLGGQGKALSLPYGATSAGNTTAYRAFANPSSQVTFAGGFKLTQLDNTTVEAFNFLDASLNSQFSIGFSPLGKVVLIGEGGAVVATSTLNCSLNQTYRINMQADIATGDVVFKLDGLVDAGLTQSGLDIQDQSSGTIDAFQFRHYVSFAENRTLSWIIDDLLVVSGELIDLPPIELFVMAPTADVAVAWTRSTGANNYANVDEIPYLPDVDYNTSITVGQKDILQFGALPRTPELIFCVSSLSMTKKDEVALRQIRNVLRIGGVDYADPADFTELETTSHYFTHRRNNPATAVPFVGADFPLQGGYELRA